MGNCIHHYEDDIPIIGEIDNELFIYPPVINDKKYGKSRNTVGVLCIDVSDNPCDVFKIGKIAKQELFQSYPPFVLKVCSTSSLPREGVSDYANPSSVWYNVFSVFMPLMLKIGLVPLLSTTTERFTLRI